MRVQPEKELQEPLPIPSPAFPEGNVEARAPEPSCDLEKGSHDLRSMAQEERRTWVPDGLVEPPYQFQTVYIWNSLM